MSLEEKLESIRFNVDKNPHITVDYSICEGCGYKPCLYICPVKNFRLQEGKLNFVWPGCIECGACRVACPALGKGAVKWEYPRGGYGVSFRYG